MAKRKRDENPLIKQLIQEYQPKSAGDVQNILKDMFGQLLEDMLKGELNHELGYEKHDVKEKDTDNSRNGYSKKTVNTSMGPTTIDIPRDRKGRFVPRAVAKHQTDMSEIENQVLAMYAKGLSTRDIQDHLQQVYGVDASPSLISQITDKVFPQIREWQSRPLESIYAFVFLDAIHFKVRQDGQVKNKAAYTVIGIDSQGYKDVLGIWIGESESSRFWLSVLTDLKNRGVEDILIVSVDNLTGFNEAIRACYPRTHIQKCIVHQIRNSMTYVPNKERKLVMEALKPIYQASTEDEALAKLEAFDAAWGKKYPPVIRSWRNNWTELSHYFRYSPEIRKIIYTTNLIENFHRSLRKVTKSKSLFPSDEALLKILYLVTQDVTKKWTGKVQNWGIILTQLSILFDDRIGLALK